MDKAWSEVEASSEYKALPANEQSQAKQEYFSTVVATKDEYKALPDSDKAAAQQEFLGTNAPDMSLLGTAPYQGGAMSPANLQAQQAVKQAQGKVNNLDPQIAAVGAAYNASWPASAYAMQAMGTKPTGSILGLPTQNVPQATTGGGALMQDIGGIANPLTGEVVNIGLKGIGTVGKAIGNTIPQIPTIFSSSKAANLEKVINKAFIGVKQAATDKFGKDLEALSIANPNKTVSLRGVVDNINQNIGDMAPEAQAVFRKTPILKDLIDNPKLANDVPLKDTQEILNYINTKVPKNIKYNHLDVLDTLHDVKASQLDAFPEMAGVKADYQKIIEPYNQVKQYFRFNKTLNSIKNGFGGPSGIEAVKKLGLPEDVINQIGGYKNASKLIKASPWLVGGALGTDYGIKKLLGK